MLEGGLGTSLKMSLSISPISLVSVSFFLRCRDVIAFSPDKEGLAATHLISGTAATAEEEI